MVGSVMFSSVMVGSVKLSIRRSVLTALALLGLVQACGGDAPPVDDTQTFRVRILKVNGVDPPTVNDPLPANSGKTNEEWEVVVEAVGPDGATADFDGLVNLSVRPGAVVSVVADDGESLGRNLRLSGGKASAIVTVTAVYGPARLWAEDLGYDKAEAGTTPLCANGKNDDPDDDVLVDFPNDPGCAFADDDSELAGTFAAGTSPAVNYELPSVQDIQGFASETPFPFESITVNTSKEHELIVTRYSKDGFYVTDLSGQSDGYNSLFIFTFSTPFGIRPCDRVTYLSGTISEFFGFTELNFPSFDVDPLFEGEEDKCKIPAPIVLDPDTIDSPTAMEAVESGLVRIEGYHVSQFIGPKLSLNNVFAEGQSNCDLNGDGKIDFDAEAEAACGNACSDNPECSEWTGFVARGNYTVAKQAMNSDGALVTSVIQVQTDGAPQFSPVANPGATLTAVTGTLRNFSGGNLNWTVETRCTDDLVCDIAGCAVDEEGQLLEEALGPKEACIVLRTLEDNDGETN